MLIFLSRVRNIEGFGDYGVPPFTSYLAVKETFRVPKIYGFDFVVT